MYREFMNSKSLKLFSPQLLALKYESKPELFFTLLGNWLKNWNDSLLAMNTDFSFPCNLKEDAPHQRPTPTQLLKA